MICTIKDNETWGKEILYSQVPGGQQLEVPEDTVKLLQECEINRVQEILNNLLGSTTNQ